jgi:3-oxoacyl-[acyl-carrier protein] reductase
LDQDIQEELVSMKNNSLKGKTALILGGSSGIGFESAKILSEQGARLILIARDNEKLIIAKKKLNQKNHQFLTADLTNPKDVKGLIRSIEKDLPHIVIANFFDRAKPLGVTKLDDSFFRNIENNIFALIELIKICIPFQRQEKFGRWVAVSSMVAELGSPNQVIYASQKNVLETLFKNLAIEESEFNITANIIRAGLIDTEGLKNHYSKEKIEALSKMNLFKRAGTSEEVAFAVSFFANPKSSYITGTILPVCGGYDLAWELKK